MAKSLFDHLNAIYQDQSISYYDDLSESDRKTYSVYMINRYVSMNPNQVPLVNELQLYYDYVTPRSSYLFYSQFIPKGRQYNKYIKASKKEKYDGEVVKLVAKKYMISTEHAKEYLDLYYQTEERLEELKDLLRGFGWDEKRIKKSI